MPNLKIHFERFTYNIININVNESFISLPKGIRIIGTSFDLQGYSDQHRFISIAFTKLTFPGMLFMKKNETKALFCFVLFLFCCLSHSLYFSPGKYTRAAINRIYLEQTRPSAYCSCAERKSQLSIVMKMVHVLYSDYEVRSQSPISCP